MSTSVDEAPGGIVVADEEVEGSRPRACWSVRECDWRDGLPEDVIELLAPPVIVSAEAFVPAVEPTVPAYDLQPAVAPAVEPTAPDGDAELPSAFYGGAEVPPVLDAGAEVPPVHDADAEAPAASDDAEVLAASDDAEMLAASDDAEMLAASDDAEAVAYRPRHAAPEEPPVTFTVPPRRLRRRRPAAA